MKKANVSIRARTEVIFRFVCFLTVAADFWTLLTSVGMGVFTILVASIVLDVPDGLYTDSNGIMLTVFVEVTVVSPSSTVL